MPRVTYVRADGERTTLDVPSGTSVMQAAIDNNIDGIVGECGGSAMCATCHVYVDEAFAASLGSPDPVEEAMLPSVVCPRRPNSRLGCQILLSDELDGLVVHLPERQT